MTEVSKEQRKKLQDVAQKLDDQVRKLHHLVRENPMRMARAAFKVKKDDLWKYMKTTYSELNDWRVDVGIGRSTFYRGVKIAEKLKHIVDKDFYALTVENAEWFAKLPKKDQTPEMLEKAKSMTEDDFIQLVQAKQKENGEMVSDTRVTIKLRCYAPQKKIIEDTMTAFAQKHSIDETDPGRILELICVEIQHGLGKGKSILATLADKIQLAAFELAQANGAYKNEAGAPLDEVVESVMKAVQNAVVILANAAKGHGGTGELAKATVAPKKPDGPTHPLHDKFVKAQAAGGDKPN